MILSFGDHIDMLSHLRWKRYYFGESNNRKTMPSNFWLMDILLTFRP
jgi:lipid-A-disaccharide synthase-like uncharacterized protein